MPASVWIINLVILSAVYEADLGRRRITSFRLARPILLAAGIIAFYLKGIASHGTGLTFELALAGVGVGLGLAAGSLVRVFRGPGGLPWSRAGVAYAALWAGVISARIAFADATSHVHSLQRWLFVHHISASVLTDGLIFMAAGMLLARTASLVVRAGAVRGQTEPSRSAEYVTAAVR